MTKDELIALAREGKAHIEEWASHIVTRYGVSESADNDGEADVLFVTLCEEGTVHDAYFSGEEGVSDLTADEIDIVRTAIETKLRPQ